MMYLATMAIQLLTLCQFSQTRSKELGVISMCFIWAHGRQALVG